MKQRQLLTTTARPINPTSYDVLAKLARGVLHERAQGPDKAHLFNGARPRVEQLFGAYQVGQATSSTDGHVQAIARKEKLRAPRHVVAGRGGHGEEHHRCFASLKLVDGADLDAALGSAARREPARGPGGAAAPPEFRRPHRNAPRTARRA